MYLSVKVIPKSSKTELVEEMADGTLKIRLKAAPEKGRANAELIRFLSQHFAVPSTEIKIISGHSSPHKLLRLKLPT